MIIANVLSVRVRFNSAKLSHIVGGGCGHFVFSFMHALHDFDRSLYRTKSQNSCATASLVVHPRSQRNDFSASAVRFLDNSQDGVSGIPLRAIIVKIGKNKQIRDAVLHAINVFNTNIVQLPNEKQISV